MADDLEELCLTCRLLGECRAVVFQDLVDGNVCPDWWMAPTPVIEARKEARERTGSRALEAMLLKDPPKKPARKLRRS